MISYVKFDSCRYALNEISIGAWIIERFSVKGLTALRMCLLNSRGLF